MKKAILVAALLVAGTASAAVPTQYGMFMAHLHSDDINNVFYGSPPEGSTNCEDGPGNPGTIKCTGNAGEEPSDGNWGTGDRGRGR
jgi:hypothetical protein